MRQAYEGGINYYDLAAGDGKAFPMYGKAFADVRKHMSDMKQRLPRGD